MLEPVPSPLAFLQDSKRAHVTWECQTQLYRNEKETGDDIRLSVRLFQKCNRDYQKFCKDVEPGHMPVQVRQMWILRSTGHWRAPNPHVAVELLIMWMWDPSPPLGMP